MNVIQDVDFAQFDIWDLDITACYNATNGAQLDFEVTSPAPVKGSVLQVKFGST